MKAKPGSSAGAEGVGRNSAGGYGNRFSAGNMTRGQGGHAYAGNTEMSFSTSFWTSVKQKK
jgi:hypothetical protein